MKGVQEKILRECVLRHAGAEPAVFRRTPAGKFNDSFFFRAGGRDYVIRVAPPEDSPLLFYEKHMMRREPGIHAILGERTSAPVPAVAAYDFSRNVMDRDYIIMERLPGEPLGLAENADVDAVLRETGRIIAEVHSVTGPKYGYPGPDGPMEPSDSWENAFAVMWEKLLKDVVSTGHYSPGEAGFMERLFSRHSGAFITREPPSLLHMDVWSQNILVSGGALSGIIDWDRALWGDIGMEFSVLDYCGISTPAFMEGYGRGRDLSEEAGVRGAFYRLYEHQKYILIRHGRENSPGRAAAYAADSLATARALESRFRGSAAGRKGLRNGRRNRYN